MSTVFLFCALIGGTFLVCQFVMSLVGLGHGEVHLDVDHDVAGADVHQGDDVHGDTDGDADGDDSNGGHHSSWLFKVISFRTLVAATTFFGLAGMTAHSSGLTLPKQLAVAIASGGAAMFGVHWLMQSFYRLSQSGTLRISSAVGRTATVNVSIPQQHTGRGKVLLEVQGRLEEFSAVTAWAENLATGAQVTVIAVVEGNVLEVEPVGMPAPIAA